MIYDLITVGGGLAGAALATALASAGARVLVLERERAFRDRVRGEVLFPWGVAEVRALGLYGTLRAAGAHEVRHWVFGEPPAERRDLVATTPAQAPCLTFYHPQMQEALLRAAEAAGAEVRRGAAVVGVTPGRPATLAVRERGREYTLQARLVAGADGRRSRARAWGGFDVRRDPLRLVIVGVLLTGLDLPDDAVRYVWKPGLGYAMIFPLGGGRFRCYYGYHRRARPRLPSGAQHLEQFIAACVEAGARQEWFAGARAAGPLAAFEGADTWVERPYRAGVALIGDAAAASDPNWGCGMSLALRDVRLLRDFLLAGEDWEAAGQAYAAEHDRSYAALHRIEDWLTELYFGVGPQADERRARALPRLREEPERGLDIVGLGPDGPSDEQARRRLFGED